MSKALLVINPRSGKGKAATLREPAEQLAATRGFTMETRTIAEPGDGARFAEEAVRTGVQRVVSIGGDGTLNSLAKGLIGTPVALGVVPMGSGNGYARSLGLPRDPGEALRLAFQGAPEHLDIGYLNDHLFLGTAGIGFDARVAWAFDKSLGRGMWNYARLVMKDIFSAKPMHTVIKANNETREADVLMLVFCNTREFGNGAIISPSSRPDDGMAELRIVRKPALPNLALAMARMYLGWADGSRYIVNLNTCRATVHQTGTLAHLDGEPVELGHEIEFRLEPKRLWVVKG